nr:uncharacterized protein LOC112698200 [Arachis hypogaea]
MSGLSINFDKSSLIPVNCDEQWVQRMCSVLGCKQANLPVKYLGILLGANPRMVKTWKPVIDKVEEKLSLWKAKILNKAGVAGGHGSGGYIKLQFHEDYLERSGSSQGKVVCLVCPDWKSQYEGKTESAWGHSPRR